MILINRRHDNTFLINFNASDNQSFRKFLQHVINVLLINVLLLSNYFGYTNLNKLS